MPSPKFIDKGGGLPRGGGILEGGVKVSVTASGALPEAGDAESLAPGKGW